MINQLQVQDLALDLTLTSVTLDKLPNISKSVSFLVK
jgi:hypothetical protein